jgi:hypothetical protein
MSDELSKRNEGLLQGSYDCVDRVLLNGYYGLCHSAGGFRMWWSRLKGGDEPADRNLLMRMAGHFSRRLRAYAAAHGIPVVNCAAGQEKHKLAKEYLEKTSLRAGVFLILVGRAQAPVWDVSPHGHLEWKPPMPFVNHYSFHILDPDWGHVTIRLSGHPPFPAQIILNGHEYVACQARKAGVEFHKEENCFTSIVDVAGLAQIADTLSESLAIGRLRQVCERWIYSSCLCFALRLEEQERSGFQYQYSIYQIEYSRNLLFREGRMMEEVFQALIDRSRGPMDVKKIKTILGQKRGPVRRARRKRAAWEVAVERPEYDLTVFKVRCGLFTLKIYTKGERVLRVETIAHNAKKLRCGYSLQKFAEIVQHLQGMLERFLEVLSCVDQCFVGSTTLEELPVATQVGKTRVGGVDVNRPRMRWVVHAVLALASSSRGFTASQLAHQVRSLSRDSESKYGSRHAAYDLKKLRGKQMVRRIEQTRRYEVLREGLRAMTALLVLRDKVLRPLLAGAQSLEPSRGAHNPTPIDHHYEVIRIGMQGVFHELGIGA